MTRYLHVLLCKVRGHKWRRLHKAEPADESLRGQLRVCRCGATRLAAQRKVK